MSSLQSSTLIFLGKTIPISGYSGMPEKQISNRLRAQVLAGLCGEPQPTGFHRWDYREPQGEDHLSGESILSDV